MLTCGRCPVWYCRFSAQYREYKYLIAYRPPQAPAAADTPMLEAGVAGNGAGMQGAAGAADAGAAAGGQAAGQAAPVGQALDVAAMQEAAAAFVGEHDFRHFCKVRGLCHSAGVGSITGPALYYWVLPSEIAAVPPASRTKC